MCNSCADSHSQILRWRYFSVANGHCGWWRPRHIRVWTVHITLLHTNSYRNVFALVSPLIFINSFIYCVRFVVAAGAVAATILLWSPRRATINSHSSDSDYMQCITLIVYEVIMGNNDRHITSVNDIPTPKSQQQMNSQREASLVCFESSL